MKDVNEDRPEILPTGLGEPQSEQITEARFSLAYCLVSENDKSCLLFATYEYYRLEFF